MKTKTILAITLFSLCLFVLFSSTLFASEHKLIVLHTNDIHGRIETQLEAGQLGMPLIGALVKEYRAEYSYVLVLDAGDTLHGRPITDRLAGESAVLAMNLVGYDYMVPGNHDFNYGYERLLELEAEFMEFSLLAANVFQDGVPLFAPYAIKDFGPFKVGIIGVTTESTPTSTHPKNVEGIEFSSIALTIAPIVELLRNVYEVDLVIGLGHIGHSVTTALVQSIPGIDLFVDGHSHSRLPEGEVHNGTLIVQAHEYGRYLGKVEVILGSAKPSMTASLIPAANAAHLEPIEAIEEMLAEARIEVRRRLLGN